MSKVFIEETTLTNIGAAIREKTGKSDLIAPGDMPKEIRGIVSGGGGGEDIEPIVLTGDCQYSCSGALAERFIELYPNKITTNNITDASNMFEKYTLNQIPFSINLGENAQGVDLSYMFYMAENLIEIPDMVYKNTSGNYEDMALMFYSCKNLKSVPYIHNAYPSSLRELFSGCHRLRYIPDDWGEDWIWSRVETYKSVSMCEIFYNCYSLRKLPRAFMDGLSANIGTSTSNCLYHYLVANCYVLDEIVDLPVSTATLTSNMFTNTTANCYRLKRYTFKTNEDGTAKTANWKSQTIDLSVNIGYAAVPHQCLNYNSGITSDKQVKDDATYQALKNDEDSYVTNLDYSRYNRTSAVETINSLPDTSAYGTNTIKFKGNLGALTDGGAINTMTEEEIAVATAKGWTVTIV